ncbi:MAG: hypothetical protein IH933_16415 [Euryarchaeota archaeon]|nr:hypothetical protein [Euryarchaeota archaeon]
MELPDDPRFVGCFATCIAGSNFDPGNMWLCVLGCYAMTYMTDEDDNNDGEHEEDDDDDR